MGRKNDRDNKRVAKLTLVTAVVALVTQIIELISKLIEWLTSG